MLVNFPIHSNSEFATIFSIVALCLFTNLLGCGGQQSEAKRLELQRLEKMIKETEKEISDLDKQVYESGIQYPGLQPKAYQSEEEMHEVEKRKETQNEINELLKELNKLNHRYGEVNSESHKNSIYFESGSVGGGPPA